jgi:hypothetical protein
MEPTDPALLSLARSYEIGVEYTGILADAASDRRNKSRLALVSELDSDRNAPALHSHPPSRGHPRWSFPRGQVALNFPCMISNAF